ncbi:MAG: nicotinate-nucleotide adenylyltransferase [Pyrinomonadaceae bacterium]
MQRKRIAIYGGTFDPVHSAHLEIARKVSEVFVIDEFLFVPARLAPHKLDREVSSALHRYAMLALATEEEPRLRISTFELEGEKRQYTVDTLLHFSSEQEQLADLFFVMGGDSWSEITTWRQWERLISLCNLIVVTRPGFEISTQAVAPPGASVVDVRGMNRERISALVQAGKQKIFLTDAVMLDVSATKVRQAVRENRRENLTKLVPPAVADYIGKYRLYRNTNEA